MKKQHLYTSDEKLKWWGYGEWVEEVDYVSFRSYGFKCEVSRLPLGRLRGSVFLPPSHPWKEVSLRRLFLHFGAPVFERRPSGVKGGFCVRFSLDGVEDMLPGLPGLRVPGKVYRNVDYCIRECRRLAKLAKIATDSDVPILDNTPLTPDNTPLTPDNTSSIPESSI